MNRDTVVSSANLEILGNHGIKFTVKFCLTHYILRQRQQIRLKFSNPTVMKSENVRACSVIYSCGEPFVIFTQSFYVLLLVFNFYIGMQAREILNNFLHARWIFPRSPISQRDICWFLRFVKVWQNENKKSSN